MFNDRYNQNQHGNRGHSARDDFRQGGSEEAANGGWVPYATRDPEVGLPNDYNGTVNVSPRNSLVSGHYLDYSESIRLGGQHESESSSSDTLIQLKNSNIQPVNFTEPFEVAEKWSFRPSLKIKFQRKNLKRLSDNIFYSKNQNDLFRSFLKKLAPIVIPVLSCLFMVSFLVRLTAANYLLNEYRSTYYGNPLSAYTISKNEISFKQSIYMSSIIIGQIILLTVVILVLFHYKKYRLIMIVLAVPVLGVLSITTYLTIYNILQALTLELDWFTFVFFIWNFTVTGILSLFHGSSPIVRKSYMIVMSCELAYVFTMLPDITTWILLGLITIWDLFAVLCPFGPLKLLLDVARRDNKNIPAFVFATMAWLSRDNQKSAHKISKKQQMQTKNYYQPTYQQKEQYQEQILASYGKIYDSPELDMDEYSSVAEVALFAQKISEIERNEGSYQLNQDVDAGIQRKFSRPSQGRAAGNRPNVDRHFNIYNGSGNTTYNPSGSVYSNGNMYGAAAGSNNMYNAPMNNSHFYNTNTAYSDYRSQDNIDNIYNSYNYDDPSREFSMNATIAKNKRMWHRNRTPNNESSSKTNKYTNKSREIHHDFPGSCSRPSIFDGELKVEHGFNGTFPNVASTAQSARSLNPSTPNPEQKEGNKIELGIGDFVFYSILVGHAATMDWVATVACIFSVISGLVITVFILEFYQKALPALPVSILLGSLTYFSSYPLVDALALYFSPGVKL